MTHRDPATGGPRGRTRVAATRSDGYVNTIEGTEGIHWVAVDPSGNVYAASNRSYYLRKYSKVGATN